MWRLVALLALAGAACSADAAPRRKSVLIDGVPFVRQKPDFCGEAVAESWLRKLGRALTQEDVFERSGMDPARGMGATTRELKRALEELGFDPGRVWGTVAARSADAELERAFGELHEDLGKGVPSIVCTRFDEAPDTTEHFRLVLGYDAARDEVVFHDPALDRGGYRRMPRARFLSLWPLKYAADRWTVIRLRLAGRGEPAARAAAPGVRPAAIAQHVMTLRARAPGFAVVVEPPFVVLGDEPLERVQRHAEHTVRWARERLRRDFFDRDPEGLLDVWLFRDAGSYRKHTRRLWNETPDTPYGYYTEEHRALVMNIATGGGTLVHEIVHPYMDANFPACPAWYNEGLGSLFEQSADDDGHIKGLPNWRLEGLQEAIRAGRTLPFERLLGTSRAQFYGDDSGLHYAQARYLLYYLQEQGLLVRFHRAFLAGHRKDPTGYRTLVEVLGKPDMAAFEARWRKFVLGLRFP